MNTAPASLPQSKGLIRPSAAPIVIGHRGACGYVPEHTLTSYFIAMQQGADYIEPDLVMTRDGVLVARHENEIGGTTDVAQRPEYAGRHATRHIDGVPVTGWFTEDFTLAELKGLRARERIPQVRPANARFDDRFEIPTLEEILALVRGVQQQREARARQLRLPAPRPIGVYPETKHPTYFTGIGLPMEQSLVDTLHRHGYHGRDGLAFIQCFEVSNLKMMRGMTQLPIVQLIDSEGAPYDSIAAGERRSYAQLIHPAGLAEIATYADAIGPYKLMVIPRTAQDTLGTPTGLVAAAHAAGLQVHAWTFRAENTYLPANLRRPGINVPETNGGAQAGAAGAQLGDLQAELLEYLRAGLDGFFTDHPDLGASAREAWLRMR